MKTTTYLKSLTVALIAILLQFISAPTSNARCTFVINSSNGYTVNVEVSAVGVNAPTNCPNGYNYTIDMDYVITFSGNNIPSGMYTLQGYLDCGSNKNMYFDLPNSGGVGRTETATTWRNASDCETANVHTLQCNELRLKIHGPGIPNQTLSCSEPLPVELVNFEAVENNGLASIKWVTATETNNDFFTLFRSTDGVKWDSIQRIQGSGNSLSLKTYTTTDILPFNEGVVYYRLKQTDFNGEYTFPAVAVVKPGSDLSVLKFSPNPAKTSLTLTTSKRQLGSIVIINAVGQDVTQEVQLNTLTATSAYIDLNNLPTGIYTVVTPAGTGKFEKN